jgi:hypothetical protein
MDSTTSILTAVLTGGLAGSILTGVGRFADRILSERSSSRAAWRLLRFEVGDALETVMAIERDKTWRIGYHREWYDTWRNSRNQLITRPPTRPEQFETVAAACARLAELQSAVNEPRDYDSRRLTDADEVFLHEMRQLLEEACAVLEYKPRHRAYT